MRPTNTGLLPTASGCSRLQVRFRGNPDALRAATLAVHRDLPASEAAALGLVTATPDLDWEDEIRLVPQKRRVRLRPLLTGGDLPAVTVVRPVVIDRVPFPGVLSGANRLSAGRG